MYWWSGEFEHHGGIFYPFVDSPLHCNALIGETFIH